jgi:hypothetical protein
MYDSTVRSNVNIKSKFLRSVHLHVLLEVYTAVCIGMRRRALVRLNMPRCMCIVHRYTPVLLSWPVKIAVLLLFFGYLAVSIVGECS